MNILVQSDIDVIYINYFSYKELKISLNSFFKCFAGSSLNFSIFILDNSFTEANKNECQSLTDYCRKYNNLKFKIEYIPSFKNLGYGAGCNKSALMGNSKNILIINCDTDFSSLEPEKFVNLLNLIDHKNVIGGPKVVDSRNLLHASCFSFDPLSIALKPLRHVRKMGRLSKFIPKYKWFKNRIDRINYDSLSKNSISYVDWISGCFMIINREFFMNIGGFDDRFFLYFEDVDICRSAKQMGSKVIFDPRVEVIHHAKYQSSSYKGILNSIIFNKTARYHICSWLKYMWKWKRDFLKLIYK